MSTQQDFAALVSDDILPSRMPDVGLIRDYLTQGCRYGNPICLSFGETWSQAPTEMLAHLDGQPRRAHGYQLSMYGLPALRRAVRDYVIDSQRLGGVTTPGRDYEIGATWTGTRGAMYDFGRFLLDEDAVDGRTPVVLTAGPSWDYEGVFGSLGYRVSYHNLRPERRFHPSAEEFGELVRRIRASADQRLALVVVNAQHNPTAVNWDPRFVDTCIETAITDGAGLLLDDAYYAVHDPGVEPTSALRQLLVRLDDAPSTWRRRWLAVRSLGKQFHCNGWGIGALTADPTVLDTLVNHYRLHNSLMYGGIYQHAMARWLSDPASAEFLIRQCADYAAKRRLVGDMFRADLGYHDGIHAGQCSSYLMFELPRAYQELHNGCEQFRHDCFTRTGVLFAPAWPWPYAPTATALPYMRMYLGPGPDLIRQAIERMASAGFHYHMARD
ncbi:MAG: pyridoxal phosphate-dependent aminotransferase [Kutzneria sp.]|nr:pyridoxal phosphate-dependent aminotransferase [Kutzneria sp.]